ncbi:MAG: MiaB-like tRNA modifying protein [Sphingomonas bacterium]|nr:tRNA (N(6)-L-threonylcarbamoyladenosine(37)-C(2))-methylthiotransferase MtaB [Sphingomonas bacterium]MDB5690103.1 MiaB-like tRNA modifying protein [Sphingomonas bacterium]
MSVEVLTFGCRLNLAEGEAVRAAACAAGAKETVIVNSCAVTQEAVRQAEKAIRKAHRDRPEARIVVTGCAAQLEPGRFTGMPGVSRVLGNADKLRPASYLAGQPAPPVPDVFADMSAPAPAATLSGRSRAFVQVQAGCDHRCTFCIIPFARGNSRSVPATAVVDRIAALVDAGAREVVLTGVDLTGYGTGDAPALGALIARILRDVPSLPRLRLSSLDTVEIDPLLAEVIVGEPRVMPHLHLSLQSGDDMILKRMRRRHGRAHAVATVAKLKAKRPDIAIGADLIAGFPTETTGMAANSLSLIEECDIVFGHIFPYSPRAGTPAARMPQVEPEVARTRARALRQACADRHARWLGGLVGTRQSVLMERGGTGHTESFAKVRMPAEIPFEAGAIADLRIVGTDGDMLLGVPA